ncbi:hypothetical protein [Marinobacter sp.]|uniref:hypothetical protein n=1 Tax=Marinobacter sp. TaxID=50741 RepID=UPI003A9422AD
MPRVRLLLLAMLLLAGCQSLPSGTEGSLPNDRILLSAQHCLNEYIEDQDRVHFGPCLKVISVNGKKPVVREDGFIELPVATALSLQTTCVYRHADGTPIPATVSTAAFDVKANTFAYGGQRWYLHAHRQARGVTGCEPTLARSIYPTDRTD